MSSALPFGDETCSHFSHPAPAGVFPWYTSSTALIWGFLCSLIFLLKKNIHIMLLSSYKRPWSSSSTWRRIAKELRVLVPKDWGAYAKKSGLMIKLWIEALYVPGKWKSSALSAWLFLCILPSLQNLIHWAHNSTAGRGVNNNKTDLKHFRDGLPCSFERCNMCIYIFF